MKGWSRMPALWVAFAAATQPAARAVEYAIASHTVDGGGGKSSGTGVAGAYTLTGTLGQPDAFRMSSGGAYVLRGGFFSQYSALQTAGSPLLSMRRQGATLVLAWDAGVPGWVLQQGSALDESGGWADVPGAPTVLGAEQFHAVSGTPGRQYFRLRKR